PATVGLSCAAESPDPYPKGHVPLLSVIVAFRGRQRAEDLNDSILAHAGGGTRRAASDHARFIGSPNVAREPPDPRGFVRLSEWRICPRCCARRASGWP